MKKSNRDRDIIKRCTFKSGPEQVAILSKFVSGSEFSFISGPEEMEKHSKYITGKVANT